MPEQSSPKVPGAQLHMPLRLHLPPKQFAGHSLSHISPNLDRTFPKPAGLPRVSTAEFLWLKEAALPLDVKFGRCRRRFC